MRRHLVPSASVGLVAALILAAPSPGRAGDATPPGLDSLERADGPAVVGTLLGDARLGFRFEPRGGAAAIPIAGPAEIAIGGTGPAPTAGVPPVQVVLGHNQRVSGQVVSLDASTIRLGDGPGGRPVVVERTGALALRQRPGEALVLGDDFETLDAGRWTEVGAPRVEAEPRFSGERSLRLDADGSAITARLAEPIAQGRLELAYHDTGAVVPGSSWFLDLLFRGEGGPETIRAVLGWSEESLAVQASGGPRPSLAIQRLARKPGWHRLEVRFGAEAELAVDGNALANGKGPSGPLVEVRLGTTLVGDTPAKVAAHVDELRLVRTATNRSAGEADPDQDEVRLVDGDQVFGAIRRGDAQKVTIDVLGQPVVYPWSQIASLQFRRDSQPSRDVSGLLVRLEWRSAPGADPRDLDQAEGALVAADSEAFTLETPYAGRLVIPRDRLRKVSVEGRGRRVVVDPTAHHLGDEVSKAPDLLDPPQPEGGVLERTFSMPTLPDAGQSAVIVLDVVQVVGEGVGIPFSQLIRAGELRTKVALDGKEFDYINKYVTTRNESPERIRVPIPPGLLKVGVNRLKLTLTGTANDPNYLDDLGILGIAVEVPTPAGKN